jgi:hypothetical protein
VPFPFHCAPNPDTARRPSGVTATGHRDPKSLRRYTRRELLHDPVLFQI